MALRCHPPLAHSLLLFGVAVVATGLAVATPEDRWSSSSSATFPTVASSTFSFRACFA